MSATDTTLRRAIAAPGLAAVVIALAALTAIRLAGLHYSTVDLFFDEAQYWAWSRELAFGYYSKPPLLAWIIAAFDPVCGSAESCVRAASPLFYFATCLVVYAIANDLYGRETAAWAALTIALGTGVSFSARIISTDVPLLFFWAVALLAFLRLMRGKDWRWALVLGLAFGFGMLAKYAMIYFLLGVIGAALFDRDARAVALRGQTWAALLLALVVIAPNVLWNAANDFVTLRHTGDNITGDGLRFRPLEPLAFVAAQLAVAGPLVFAGFLTMLARPGPAGLIRQDRLMLAFAIPPLVLVTALSFVRSTNANWAAPALLSMTIMVVAWWLRGGRTWALWATAAIGVVAQAVMIAGDAYAYRISFPALGAKADIYQRTLGWRPLGEKAAQMARSAQARTVVAEGRSEMAALIYYLRHEPVSVLNWPAGATPQHHFELTRAMTADAAEPVLVVTGCPYPERLRRYFADVTPGDPIVASSGHSSARRYHTFRLASRTRAIAPLGPCRPD